MKRNRRNSGNSGRVNNENGAVSFADDERLARRLKRRHIAKEYFRVSSDCKKRSRNSSIPGKVKSEKARKGAPEKNRVVVIDLDAYDSDVDSDYREFIDNLDLVGRGDVDDCCMSIDKKKEDSVDSEYNKFFALESLFESGIENAANNGSNDIAVDGCIQNGFSGDKAVNKESAEEDINNKKKEDSADADCDKIFPSESFVDGSVDEGRNVNAFDGHVDNDFRGVKPGGSKSAEDEIKNKSNINALQDLDPRTFEVSEGNGGKSGDDMIALDSEKLNDGSVLLPLSVIAVNGSVKNSPGGDKVIVYEAANDDINNNDDTSALGDMDPPTKEVLESKTVESDDDIMVVDTKKLIDDSVLRLPGDSVVNGSRQNMVLSTTEVLESKILESDHNIIVESDDNIMVLDVDRLIDVSVLQPSGDSAVNRSMEISPYGDKHVWNESANDDLNGNDVSNLGVMDLQTEEVPKSNTVESNDEIITENNGKLIQGSVLRPSGDCVVNGSMENSPCGDKLVDNDVNNHINNDNNVGALDDRDLPTIDHSGNLDDLNYKMFLKNLREEGNGYVLEVPLSNGIFQVIKYELDDEPRDKGRCTESLKRTKISRKATEQAKHGDKYTAACDEVDQNYNFFLNSLKKEGTHMVFVLETGAKVVYAEDEDSSSDSDVIMMDSDPFADKDYTPFVSSKQKDSCDLMEVDDDMWIKTENYSAKFRERVMEILRKPYDQKEYDTLLKEAYGRKQIIEDRELRDGRIRQHVTNRRGKSYLDLHQDLAAKINSVGATSKPKALNLLRGFFFWLQNLSHKGVFKPWTDPTCLDMLPNEEFRL